MRLHFFVKNNPFLEVQITQQVVITISLNIGLPNIVLASIIMSNGWRFISKLNWQGILVGDAKGTFEEKVKTGFFTTTIVEDTIIVIQYLVLSP
jgi:hypothetical protein